MADPLREALDALDAEADGVITDSSRMSGWASGVRHAVSVLRAALASSAAPHAPWGDPPVCCQEHYDAAAPRPEGLDVAAIQQAVADVRLIAVHNGHGWIETTPAWARLEASVGLARLSDTGDTPRQFIHEVLQYDEPES